MMIHRVKLKDSTNLPPRARSARAGLPPRRAVKSVVAVLIASLWSLTAIAQTAVGTSFSYQGQLNLSGAPVNGSVDLDFSLWDAPVVGTMIGTVVSLADVDVVDGRFAVSLDFGIDPFKGEARWLEIAVRSPAGSGMYTTLDPRQPLTPAPYALALPGLRTDETTFGWNVIGGSVTNWVAENVNYATVFGGWVLAPNSITGTGGTVSGGTSNLAGEIGTVGGGAANDATGQYSTVSGGGFNDAHGRFGTVPGGSSNDAGGAYSFAAGRRAKIRDATQADADGDEGVFMWADATNEDFISTGPNQFLIRASGGVGIGTNSPGAAMTVNALGFADAGFEIERDEFNYADTKFRAGISAGSGGALGLRMRISADNGAAWTDAMFVTESGNVGIGTTHPQSHLQVGEGDDARIQLGVSPQLSLNRDVADNKFRIQIEGSNYGGKYLQLGRDDGNHDVVVTGDLGVGTDTPTEKLEVAGRAKVQGIRFADATLQTTAAPVILSGSIAYDPNPLSPGAGTAVTVMVPGASTTDVAVASPSLSLTTAVIGNVRVSSPGIVAIQLINAGNTSIDVPLTTWRVRVFK